MNETQVIGQIVADDYRTASVFKDLGIDFCCNGNRTIKEVSEEANVEASELINKLDKVLNDNEKEVSDFKSWPLDLLVDYVERRHHRYVDRKILEIKPYLDKIERVHGGRHPELTEINKLFTASAGEFTVHMKKEEFILFPFVRKLVKVKEENTFLEKPGFGTVQNPVAMMREDHDHEGERFRQIAALSNNYTVPHDGCNTYRVTYGLLKEFEDDLHLHIHLENNIIFPKAIALERELSAVN